jgi:hypothetical protein
MCVYSTQQDEDCVCGELEMANKEVDMPNQKMSEWMARSKRQREGNWKIGEFVAQDYKVNWAKARFLTFEEVCQLITKADREDLMKAPKLILVTEVGRGLGMAAGVCYKENVNNEEPFSVWSFWIQQSKPMSEDAEAELEDKIEHLFTEGRMNTKEE